MEGKRWKPATGSAFSSCWRKRQPPERTILMEFPPCSLYIHIYINMNLSRLAIFVGSRILCKFLSSHFWLIYVAAALAKISLKLQCSHSAWWSLFRPVWRFYLPIMPANCICQDLAYLQLLPLPLCFLIGL